MAETKMQLVDWLDDLCVRFIINLPQEELESVERICFQVEEAQWFYEDFIRPLDPSLPSMPLRTFCLQMFKHCPLLASFSEYHHLAAFDEFLAYKTRVPVRGAIILNQAMDEVLLVKGWKKGANWSFPRGKINKDERDLDCAIREVYEETGYDIKAAGLIQDESKTKYIEVTMREQHMKLYVFRGIPQDTVFQPRTRKEISKIEWYKLSHLPGYHKSKHNQNLDHDETLKASKFYMVAPFLPQLKKWIAQQRRNEARHARESSQFGVFPVSDAADYYDTEENEMQRHLQHAQKDYNDYAEEANVRSNHPVNTHSFPSETMPKLSGADAATELKRMLSVGPPHIQEPAAEPGSAANLLSMLRQSGTRPPPTETRAPMPQQTYENMQLDQRQPGINQQYQSPPQRLPEMAADSAPRPNAGFAPISSNQPFQQQLPSSSMPGFDYSHNNFAPIQARRPSRPVLSPQPVTSLQQSMDKQNQSPSQQAPAPYQRTGDPHFARETQRPSQQGPTIPAAADLPPPKLSNHALSLLSAFKTGNVASGVSSETIQRPTASEITGQQPRLPQPYGGEDNQHGMSMPRRMGHQHTESRSRQALTQAISGSNAPGNSTNIQPIAPPTNPSPAQQKTQQNTLLDLFRKPSQPLAEPRQDGATAKPTLSELLQGPKFSQVSSTQVDFERSEILGQQGNTLAPEPVELSALPSPGISQPKKQLFDPKDGTMKEHIPQPRVLARPSSSHKANRDPSTSPLVSATMLGPPNVPDFGTVRRKPRPGKPSTDATENASREQEQPVQAPVQILRRPASPKKPSPIPEIKVEPKSSQKPENRRPVTPSALQSPRAPLSPAELKGSTPKPFQPQILRRPQPSPPAPSSPQFQQAPASPKAEPHQDNTNLISPPPLTSDTSPQPAATAIRPSSRTRSRQPPPTIPTLDRRSSNTTEQKQALLSLFGKSTASTPVSASAASPVLAAQLQQSLTQSLSRFTSPIASPPAGSPPPIQDPTAVSSISASMASAKAIPARFSPFSPISRASPDGASSSAVVPPATTTATGGATGTGAEPFSVVVGEEPRRGSQSHELISPVDRGFLLSYLEGFSKGPKR